jgi:hypothetical protein
MKENIHKNHEKKSGSKNFFVFKSESATAVRVFFASTDYNNFYGTKIVIICLKTILC